MKDCVQANAVAFDVRQVIEGESRARAFAVVPYDSVGSRTIEGYDGQDPVVHILTLAERFVQGRGRRSGCGRGPGLAADEVVKPAVGVVGFDEADAGGVSGWPVGRSFRRSPESTRSRRVVVPTTSGNDDGKSAAWSNILAADGIEPN